jgi:L-threonylcarbamoyladenylate synthase
MARIISTSDEDLMVAAKQINDGGLVAFPTETVYGLGARLDDKALAEIFAAKRRPYSDPLITHFATAESARKYVNLTEEESEIFDKLAKAFWPGPMTLIGTATAAVPPLVMAGTGCVGVRVPSHPIAHRLLQLSDEPIAAPSANLFGHISPTTCEHVMADLGTIEDLLIIQGGNATIGIESTVLKIQGKTITILRPGYITAGQIERICPGCVKKDAKLREKLASPGHEIKHYAPNMPTYLAKPQGWEGAPEETIELTKETVLVDFHRTFASRSNEVLRYFDLSTVGCVADAVRDAYNVLREAETTPGAKQCVLTYILKSGISGDSHDNELCDTLNDRLLRSASHQIRSLATK